MSKQLIKNALVLIGHFLQIIANFLQGLRLLLDEQPPYSYYKLFIKKYNSWSKNVKRTI